MELKKAIAALEEVMTLVVMAVLSAVMSFSIMYPIHYYIALAVEL